jgi:hypothetical protein
MPNINESIRFAASAFWATRDSQFRVQRASNRPDAGSRSAVTGGKQMSGFEDLVISVAIESVKRKLSIYKHKRLELPGYFRAEKKWDLLIFDGKRLLAAIEFKSQVGPSFGNNFNNRTEEAIGSATDLWTAYREGAFGKQPRPWLGYLFLLEDCAASTAPVRVNETHFNVFPEFKGSSYARRYDILLTKLLRERHYDSAVLLLSSRKPFEVRQPNKELAASRFFAQLRAHLVGHVE